MRWFSSDFLRSVKKERVVREAIRCLAPPIIDLFRRRHAKKEIKGESRLQLREERFLSHSTLLRKKIATSFSTLTVSDSLVLSKGLTLDEYSSSLAEHPFHLSSMCVVFIPCNATLPPRVSLLFPLENTLVVYDRAAATTTTTSRIDKIDFPSSSLAQGRSRTTPLWAGFEFSKKRDNIQSG